MTTADRAQLQLPVVRVSRQALVLPSRHAIEAGSKELGGILVGWWEDDSTTVVHDLLIVPDADAGWNPDATAWSIDLLALVALSVAGTAAAGMGLRRP